MSLTVGGHCNTCDLVISDDVVTTTSTENNAIDFSIIVNVYE